MRRLLGSIALIIMFFPLVLIALYYAIFHPKQMPEEQTYNEA